MIPEGWKAAKEGYKCEKRNCTGQYEQGARERHISCCFTLLLVHVVVDDREDGEGTLRQCDSTFGM